MAIVSWASRPNLDQFSGRPPLFSKATDKSATVEPSSRPIGTFAYTNFAQYWYDSLLSTRPTALLLRGLASKPTGLGRRLRLLYLSSNRRHDQRNQHASYSKALDAVYQRLTNLLAPPKILAPECVHIAFNDLKNYAATMNSNSFYGVTTHLTAKHRWHSRWDERQHEFGGHSLSRQPHFMTEYGITGVANMSPTIEAAWLMHNALTVEQVSGYNFWTWSGRALTVA